MALLLRSLALAAALNGCMIPRPTLSAKGWFHNGKQECRGLEDTALRQFFADECYNGKGGMVFVKWGLLTP